MPRNQSHAKLCAIALISCCVRIAEAETEQERDAARFEQLIWEHARHATEN